MNIKTYINDKNILAGITLKDEHEPEKNNMALHVCKDTDKVLHNRRKLTLLCNCALEDLVCTQQTHSSNFHKVTLMDKGKGASMAVTAIHDTDALYTFEANIMLCCFTADCVPVTFYDDSKSVIGIIHSGWKGTVKGITRRVLDYLVRVENCCLEDFHVYIGPALSQKRFEVDSDVQEQFKNLGYADDFIYFNEQTKKFHIDNQRVVMRQCELSGIKPENIIIDSTCTYDNNDYFSYRQNNDCGRHLSFVMKKTASC